MLRDDVILKLKGALPELRAEFAVRELFIFGSVARGEEHPESDVDVLVEFEPQSHPTLFTLAGIKIRLSKLLGRDVDVGTPDCLRPRVRATVEAEKLRVA
jgi:predicted nucleotidyltransferase